MIWGTLPAPPLDADTKSFNVTVDAVNDAPIVTLPSGYEVLEDAPTTPLPGIGATDPDLVGSLLSIVATVSVNQGGTLTVSPVPGVAYLTPTSGQALQFTGPLANLQNALDSITYKPVGNFNGTETLTVNLNDNGNFGKGGVKTDTKSTPITVKSVNDPPTFNVPEW